MNSGNQAVLAALAIAALVAWALVQRRSPSTTRLPWRRHSDPRAIGGRYKNRSLPWLAVPALLLALAAVGGDGEKQEDPTLQSRSLKAMSMPGLGPGDVPARPLAIALFLPDSRSMNREVRRFSRWLAQTQRWGTKIRLVRAVNGKLSMTQATSASSVRTDSDHRSASVAQVETWLAKKRFRRFTRMAIAFGPDIPRGLDERVVRTRIQPASGVLPTSSHFADPRVIGSFASAAALSVIEASGEVLARKPETSERSITLHPNGGRNVPDK